MNLLINAKHVLWRLYVDFVVSIIFQTCGFRLCCILRYKEKGNTGMSIMDIGILTGFAPDQKSLQKVNIVLLYL